MIYYPECWDFPAYAMNLQWAFNGFPDVEQIASVGDALRSNLAEDNQGVWPLPGCDYFVKKHSLQRVVHAIIQKEVFSDEQEDQLSTLVQRRITKIFAPFQIDFDNVVNLEQVFSLLVQIQPFDALKVVKTLLNGWATSHRMHEDTILPCLLGCSEGKDSFKHYVMCPHLYAFCKYFLNHRTVL